MRITQKQWERLHNDLAAAHATAQQAAADAGRLNDEVHSLRVRVANLEQDACSHSFRLLKRSEGQWMPGFYPSDGPGYAPNPIPGSEHWAEGYSKWKCVHCGFVLRLGMDEEPTAVELT